MPQSPQHTTLAEMLQSQPRWIDLIIEECTAKYVGQSHLFLMFGATPPISHVWGKATSFTRFLEFQFKPKEAVPRTRRLLPHGITFIRIVAIAH